MAPPGRLSQLWRNQGPFKSQPHRIVSPPTTSYTQSPHSPSPGLTGMGSSWLSPAGGIPPFLLFTNILGREYLHLLFPSPLPDHSPVSL